MFARFPTSVCHGCSGVEEDVEDVDLPERACAVGSDGLPDFMDFMQV